jgi:uncharacterized protein involved in outer membrane biogenesis
VRAMKKLIVRAVLLLLILLVIAFFARNFIARHAVMTGVRAVTGFPLDIQALDLDLAHTKVEVGNLRLLNPTDFQDVVFVDMPHFLVDYDLGALLQRTVHLTDVDLEIKSVMIVKGTNGVSNVSRLKGAVSSGAEPSGAAEPKEQSKTAYKIDRLHLKMGTVTIKDYTKLRAGKPSERVINLNVEATYRDLSDATDITRLALLTMATKVSLPELGIKVDDLTKGLSNTANAAVGVVKDAGKAVGDAGKGVFDTMKKAVPGK